MAVVTGGARWTEREILPFFPEYPDRVKSSDLKVLVRARRGAEFHSSTWDRWLRVLIEEQRLIRLPGARFARPRTAADLDYHVPAFTKRRHVAPRPRHAEPSPQERDRAQEIKAAVEATRPKKK